ncbi:MAG: trehalose-6-phosphate synthase [Alphaproteobacteria bacterium]|nr:trehalose-6-phosphate synthase [Alphaproteobacteria bacterium]
MSRLIVVSNRTPGKGPAAGGLAVALRKTLSERDGFWFGWSGKLADEPSQTAQFEDIDGLTIAHIDLTRSDHHAYYAGFSNSILWPSFHLRLDLATIEGHWYEGYRAVNQQFARALLPLLQPDDVIWVHDYHLIPLANELRSLGARNRIGFYLHIPFPTTDALYAIPHHNELMRDLSRYDLVGLQANRDVAAFTEFADHQSPSSLSGSPLRSVDFTRSETSAFPIGSDPEAFARLAVTPAATKMVHRVQRNLREQKLILGVDRLDYSKGLPQRIEAYEKLLANDPRFRRNVHMMQVAPPSRDTIKEYQETSDALDAVCGRVMGRFSEPDWQPLTYVKRAYGQPSLAGLYRLAKVGLVTPLRDGMNLVAHEFVASQDPADPGVLILSRFAGAAEIFPEAIQVNPFDTDETSEALRMALDMPLDERITRWTALMAAARRHSVDNWASSFLERLVPDTSGQSSASRDMLYLASTG